jgi:hypothetical protein
MWRPALGIRRRFEVTTPLAPPDNKNRDQQRCADGNSPFHMLLSILQIGCVVFLSCLAFLWARSQWWRLPPGPQAPGLPFLGIADILKDYEWRHWAKHKAVYGTHLRRYLFSHTRLRHTTISSGPVSYVCVLGQPIIILNSLKAYEDEKRSAIYSGRSVLQFACEIYRTSMGCAWAVI